MADLGTIGFFGGKGGFSSSISLRVPANAFPPTVAPKVKASNIGLMQPGKVLLESDGLDYSIEGVVSVLGTPTAGLLVRAYRRDNGVFLGEDISVAGGAFAIIINGYDGEVFCVAFDNTGVSPDYNALVFDRVIPLAA